MSPRLVLALAGILAALAWLEWALRRRGRRLQPASDAPTVPDWSASTGYRELASAAAQADGLAPDAFLDGPFRRFLELGSAGDAPVRVRARAMEFGRAALHRYRDSQAERGAEVADLELRARAMAVEWFARPDARDGNYMLAVFDGLSDHNFYRGEAGG